LYFINDILADNIFHHSICMWRVYIWKLQMN